MAKEFARDGYAHFEADMYFERDGAYEYDATRTREAHGWCQGMTRQALASGRNTVVSNTFTQLREMGPYRSMSGKVRVSKRRAGGKTPMEFRRRCLSGWLSVGSLWTPRKFRCQGQKRTDF